MSAVSSVVERWFLKRILRRFAMMKRMFWGIAIATLVPSLAVTLLRGQTRPAADPLSDGASNVRLVGFNDLQGREALVVTTKSDAANGSWVYVGHHDSYWDNKPKMNPITGKMEWNGTSILDVADPAKPKYVWHIPNEANRNSRGVSVVYDYKFDSSGKDYLIRNSEALTEGETGRSEEHTSELQSLAYLVCRLLLEKKKKKKAD